MDAPCAISLCHVVKYTLQGIVEFTLLETAIGFWAPLNLSTWPHNLKYLRYFTLPAVQMLGMGLLRSRATHSYTRSFGSLEDEENAD